MKYPTFKYGEMFESKTHGTVRFVGIDTYFGETTYCFESLTYGGKHYWKPEALHVHLSLEVKLPEPAAVFGWIPAGIYTKETFTIKHEHRPESGKTINLYTEAQVLELLKKVE